MQLNNDEGNIGIITDARQIENLEEQTNILFKIGNKLEKRIATLERVLQSHAKCIGEMRDKKDDLKDMPEEVLVKTWEAE
jgi:hypothetical protein